MALIFKKLQRTRTVTVIKSTGAAAGVLSRLRAFLDASEPQTVQFLVNAWGEQQNAITYKELREAALSGGLSETRLAQWRIDYSNLVTEKLASEWEKAMLAAAEELKRQFPYFLYNPSVGLSQEYIRQRGAFLVTNIIEEQRNALQAAIMHAMNLDETMTADALSRLLRPMVGLNQKQAIANARYYETVKLGFLEANMGIAAAENKAREMALRYAHRQHRYRAMMIARTELAMAYNEGNYLATLDAQEQGYLGDMKKTWLTADDELVCKICGGLNGDSVNLNALFSIGVLLPPAHPNCRCALLYEEIAPAIIPQ